MVQPLLPMFPSDVTEINPLMSFAKREGTVYYFNGPMPVFSHAESDRASFAMFASQMVVNGNCRQAEIVRAFGISAISVKRYVKRYRQSGTAGFFPGPQDAAAPGYSAAGLELKRECSWGVIAREGLARHRSIA